MKPLKENASDQMKIPYRWFFTSTGKLVVGGKSSTQNDELLMKLKRSGKEYTVLHTTEPGSPFVVIRAPQSEISENDLDESAIFTGCFSRAWKLRKKKTTVDIFNLSQLFKTKEMKAGTWGIKGKIKRVSVKLELVLIKQEGKLRAVPEKTADGKNYFLKVRPGKNDKSDMLVKFQFELKQTFTQEELLAALPAGGVTIVRN